MEIQTEEKDMVRCRAEASLGDINHWEAFSG